MKRTLIHMLGMTCAVATNAQFPPPAGQPGTTAIAQDSAVFVAWASDCTLALGPQDISSVEPIPAAIGDETSAVGEAGANGVVSLGDGGTAVLTFAQPITNGPGWDFAVFENSFSDVFLELAFVEVSSNGVDFVRFPATSNTQTVTQVGGFGSIDATEIDNLAGKYRGGFGTPFDLEELAGTPGLDISSITHVKIIDVVGCIQEAYATYDHLGQVVNDPWSTPFASSGFDLDAVGVINQLTVGVDERASSTIAVLFPNPATDRVNLRIEGSAVVELTLFDASGRIAFAQRTPMTGTIAIDLGSVPAGSYVMRAIDQHGLVTRHPLIVHAH